MSQARFRYALQPILLTRQWDLDALLRQLGDLNADLAERRRELDAVAARSAAAGQEWHALHAAAQPLSVDRYTLLSRYLGQLGRELAAGRQALAELERRRDELIAQLLKAQRAVEAVEQHRDAAQAKHVQLRRSGEFKLADDQWNTASAGRVAHDS